MKYRLALSRKQFFLFSFLIALVFLSLHAAHQNRYLTLIPDDRDVEPAAKNSLSPASSQQKLIIPLEDAFPETQIVTHVPGVASRSMLAVQAAYFPLSRLDYI